MKFTHYPKQNWEEKKTKIWQTKESADFAWFGMALRDTKFLNAFIIQLYYYNHMNTSTGSQWNLINILNVAPSYANNSQLNFTRNIAKVLCYRSFHHVNRWKVEKIMQSIRYKINENVTNANTCQTDYETRAQAKAKKSNLFRTNLPTCWEMLIGNYGSLTEIYDFIS